MSESERVSADEWAYLQKALQAKAVFDHFAHHLATKYHLGPQDGVDDTTGEIVRGTGEGAP